MLPGLKRPPARPLIFPSLFAEQAARSAHKALLAALCPVWCAVRDQPLTSRGLCGCPCRVEGVLYDVLVLRDLGARRWDPGGGLSSA